MKKELSFLKHYLEEKIVSKCCKAQMIYTMDDKIEGLKTYYCLICNKETTPIKYKQKKWYQFWK